MGGSLRPALECFGSLHARLAEMSMQVAQTRGHDQPGALDARRVGVERAPFRQPPVHHRQVIQTVDPSRRVDHPGPGDAE